jgi:hypothetical protein
MKLIKNGSFCETTHLAKLIFECMRVPTVKEDVTGRTCSTHGSEEECKNNLGGKGRPERWRQLGRRRSRLVDNIKLDLRE